MIYHLLTCKKTGRIIPVGACVIITVILLVMLSESALLEAKSTDVRRTDTLFQSLKTRVPVYFVHVKNMYPHDAESFTEGLFFYQGHLYESAGLYKKSSLARKDRLTGKTLHEVRLPDRFFGEGIALLKGKIYQLTWREQIAFVYEADSLKKIGQITYQGEGWGLTTDGRYLLMSDGSPVITFRHPDTFAAIRTIVVHDGAVPIGNLNELEYVGDEIWANIFMRDIIARISPADGRVVGWIDLSSLRLLIPDNDRADVLNGIACDAKTGRIFVTGKYWPLVFEIQLSAPLPPGPQLP